MMVRNLRVSDIGEVDGIRLVLRRASGLGDG